MSLKSVARQAVPLPDREAAGHPPRGAPGRPQAGAEGAAAARDGAVPSEVVEGAAKAHEAAVDARHLAKIVEALNEVLADRNVGARFVVRRDLDELQVVLENRTTGEVVRKIPPDEVIRRREELSRLEGIGLDAIV